MTENIFKYTRQSNILLDDGYLITKIYKQSDDCLVFNIYDTSHSIFPKGDFKNSGVSNFKMIGHYSFGFNENNLYKEFLESLQKQKIITITDKNKELLDGFFILEENIFSPTSLKKESDSGKYIKLHLSSDNRIANFNKEQFLKDHGSVILGAWRHEFMGISDSNLGGLRINEVELDTSVFLNLNYNDEDFKNAYDAISYSLIASRH